MKYGFIAKSAVLDEAQKIVDMALINGFSRKELLPDDVYIFNVAMCDNEVDRDFENFSVDALGQLAELYKGKTMISDHNPKSNKQVARIFDTYVEAVAGEVTKSGEQYTRLVGRAYMLIRDSNKDIIDDIDAGIIKEVSVGCKVSIERCSICGKDRRKESCEHRAGREYDKEVCHFTLENATDAYELSLVAIPAQRGAGIIKRLKEKGEDVEMEILEKVKGLFGVELAAEDNLEGALTKVCTKFEEIKKSFADGVALKMDEFLSEDVVKSKLGTDVTAEKALEMLGGYGELKAKATEFDTLKAAAIETALSNGIKAKGERFNRDIHEKTLKSLSYAEVTAMSNEWAEDAAISLKAGMHVSQYGTKVADSAVNVEDFMA